MLNQHIEKNAVAEDMIVAESIVSQAYKKGVTSRRVIGKLYKKLQSRRNVVAKIAPSKYKGYHSAYTIESSIHEGRVSFDSHCFMFAKNTGAILSNNIPFTIANHALARYFQRTQETDFLIEYKPALAFYCLYSMMYILDKLDSTDIIIPCESGLLLSSITGIEKLKFDLFQTSTLDDKNSRNTINEAAAVIAKTFVSHNEMFKNQTALWENMMTFYDKHEAKFDDVFRMFVSPLESSITTQQHINHLLPFMHMVKEFDETVYCGVKSLQNKP